MSELIPNPVAAQVTTPPPQAPPPVVPPNQAPPNPVAPAQAVLGGNQTQAPPQPTPQQMDVAHSAVVGHGFKSLMSMLAPPGSDTPVSPTRRFFSSILSGAIAGGAAGSENRNNTAGSGWSAAGIGAGAAQKQQQQQAQLAAQQKQQQFENQLKLTQENREDQVRKAQITMYNMQKLKDIQAIQGGDYTSHKQFVADAAPKVASYAATGLKPVKENISESDYEKLKDTPGWTGLDWQPVGVDHFVGKDGVVNYQTVWDAYDPKGPITITPQLWSDWKANGVLDKEPNLAAVLKPDENGNRSIPYSAFTKYDAESMSGKAANKQKAADDYTTKEQALNLQHLAAQIKQEGATAAASGDEAALRSFQLRQEKSGVDAQTALTKAGGNWLKLTTEQKVALQPQVQKDIEGYRVELSNPLLKEQLNSDDPAVKAAAQKEAGELQQNLDDARSHSIFVPPTPTAQSVPFVDPDNPTVKYNIPPDKVDAFLKAHPRATKTGTAPPATDPLESLPNTLTLVQDRQGNTTSVPNGTVDSFLKQHPEVKVVGQGKKQEQSKPQTPDIYGNPNTYQGG